MEPKKEAVTVPVHDAGKDPRDQQHKDNKEAQAKEPGAKMAASTGNPTFDAIRYVAVRIGGHVLEEVDEILGLNVEPPLGF